MKYMRSVEVLSIIRISEPPPGGGEGKQHEIFPFFIIVEDVDTVSHKLKFKRLLNSSDYYP